MKALLLIAHGSRSASANDEIRALTARLRDAGGRFDLVECAFLEMTEPNIVQSGDKLIADGASEIVVLPYFLAAGRHVAQDIPAEVARIATQHPKIKIITASHLGAWSEMSQLIHAHLGVDPNRPDPRTPT